MAFYDNGFWLRGHYGEVSCSPLLMELDSKVICFGRQLNNPNNNKDKNNNKKNNNNQIQVLGVKKKPFLFHNIVY